MSLPGSALQFPKIQMFTNLGAPAAAYKLAFYIAGTSTPLATYTDSALTTPNTNPVILDSAGRAVIYMLATGYKVVFLDPNDVVIWTQDNVFPTTYFDANVGYELQLGTNDAASSYVVTASDVFVKVASTGGADPCVVNLPAALNRGLPVTILNKGTIALAITPNGADTINEIAGAFTLGASASPDFSVVTFYPDKVSNWWTQSKYEA